MIISKKASWVAEYIELARDIVPIDKIKKVYVIPATVEKVQKIQGVLCEEVKNKRYNLGIYLKYQEITFQVNNEVKIKLRNYSKLDIIKTLAHELAHLEHWEHTTDHVRLEHKITERFLDQLDKEGYVSEEAEISGR